MKKGGYQIIDLENRDFRDGIGQQFEGIYELIEGTRKPILLSGFSFGGKEFHDTFVNPIVSGSSYYINYRYYEPEDDMTIYLNIRIQDNDVITVTEEV